MSPWVFCFTCGIVGGVIMVTGYLLGLREAYSLMRKELEESLRDL